MALSLILRPLTNTYCPSDACRDKVGDAKNPLTSTPSQLA